MEGLRAFVYANPRMPHQVTAMDAFKTGLLAHGVTPAPDPFDADFCVTWGMASRPSSLRPWLMLECGYVNGRSGDYEQDRLRFVSASWNQPHGCASPVPPGRPPPDRWTSLGIEITPWRRSDTGYTLFCEQHPGDKGAPPGSRVREVLERLRESGVVRRRSHPLTKPDQNPLAEDLAGASRVITFSSTTAVEAVLAGVPTVTLDRTSIAWPVTSHSLDGAPWVGDRRPWAYHLAYRQWTLDEYRRGEAWEYLKHGIESDH